jgi:hypothetical protein
MLNPTTLTPPSESSMSFVPSRAASRSPLGWLSALVAVAALTACDQPDPGCISTTNGFAVKLLTVGDPVESVAGACMGFGPDSFNALPEIGISPYYARGSDGQPDYDRGSVAIQTAELGTYFYTARDFEVGNAAADGQIYSLGAFSGSKPDGDNFCHVPELSPARLVLPALDAIMDDPATEDADESFPGQPTVDVTLEWSDVRVYVTPDTYGTQADANLVDTRVNANGDTCTYTYRALALAPAVSCASTDEAGNPTLDPSLCEPEADLAAGRPLGSGISPSARWECDPITAFCVIQGDTIPALL